MKANPMTSANEFRPIATPREPSVIVRITSDREALARSGSLVFKTKQTTWAALGQSTA
jgi:hypothetical protein